MKTGNRAETLYLTEDPNTLEIINLIDRVAPTEVSVLIYGESGTGKELIAKRIHEKSARATKPMVSINCGAIQEALLLSELFGHEKGAFTGATSQKVGLVEVANGGTLFLDEIGEMGIEAQSKLLRFLQDGEIYRVGGQTPIRVSCRIVSATNKDLEAQTKVAKFREDLFYRINTVKVAVPPLRKRKRDIPILLTHFLKTGTPTHLDGFHPKALEALVRYHWPGNVRELQNLVERFKVLVEGSLVRESDLPSLPSALELESESFDDPENLLLDRVERKHILRVLSHFKGNKTKAAQAMGITVKTLYNKLARYESHMTESSSVSPLIH